MKREDIRYFEKIISIQTPEKEENQTVDNYNGICSLYEAVRHLASKSLKKEIESKNAKNSIEIILKRIEELK